MRYGLDYSLSKSIVTDDDIVKWLEDFIKEYKILEKRINTFEQNEYSKLEYDDTLAIIGEFNELILKIKSNTLTSQDKIDLINYLNRAKKNIGDEGGDIGGIERYIQA